MSGAMLKTTIRYDEDFAEKIEKVKKIYHINKTTFIREAALEKAEKLLEQAEIMERLEEFKAGKAESISHEEAMKMIGLK